MTTVAEARNRRWVEPVYLAEIELLDAGPTLYLGTREIEFGGQRYQRYILAAEGLGAELARADSSGLNSTISLVFDNAPWGGYDYLIEIGDTYPWEGATVTLKDVYLDDDGAATSDSDTLYVGAIDPPQEVTLASFRCDVSSIEFLYDNQW